MVVRVVVFFCGAGCMLPVKQAAMKVRAIDVSGVEAARHHPSVREQEERSPSRQNWPFFAAKNCTDMQPVCTATITQQHTALHMLLAYQLPHTVGSKWLVRGFRGVSVAAFTAPLK